MGIVSLAAADAYKEKQAAYDQFNAIRKEMQELNVELQERYAEIGMLQKLYDDVHTRSQVEWEAHKQALNDFDERITNTLGIIQESKDLEEKFKILASEDGVSEEKAEFYLDAAEYFRQKNVDLLEKKDALLKEKRSQKRPDCAERDDLLNALKQKRAEHSKLTEKYHTLKEKCSKERAIFEQSKERYYDLLDFENLSAEDAKKARKEEILEKAQIPQDFWESAIVKEYDDGTIHIYYGADKDHAHGHVEFNGEVLYSREPRESLKLPL